MTKPSGSAGIYLLVDVVGSGKSTVAHTVAQRCSDEGFVIASFFFCRSTPWRDLSTRVVFTLATHLSKSSADYHEKMEETLEREPGLMAVSVDRQFEKLVVDPAQQCMVDQPVIIIADALDEYNDREFVHVVLCVPAPFTSFSPSGQSLIVSLPTQTHDITYTHALTRATHAPTRAAHALTRATYAPMRATYAPTTYVPGATHQHLTRHAYGHDWPGPHVHTVCLMRPSPISGNIA
jgi:hypothetical protein